ncbi:MAG TPA: hypothetical protein VK997_01675 [Deferrisomatales bacterium]|nr:hypothetical protein [Deferrisomatales bacterium]
MDRRWLGGVVIQYEETHRSHAPVPSAPDEATGLGRGLRLRGSATAPAAGEAQVSICPS